MFLGYGLYLCAMKDRYPGYSILYNDIKDYPGINLKMDCRNITREYFDKAGFIIATPPCNYYSKANFRRETSKVAQDTKILLPWCLSLCSMLNLPCIIENVNNDNLLPTLYDKYFYRFKFGGHTFWTNVYLYINDLVAVKQNKQNVCREKRDGNPNVHMVIERFLKIIHSENFFMMKVKHCCLDGHFDFQSVYE